MKVFILGAGTMGSGIVQAFAQAGYDVIMRDIEGSFVDRGMSAITKNLEKSVQKSKMTEEEKNNIL